MNPAVAFKPVADAAHSVVLTSGTLAPLEGFASEVRTVGAAGGVGELINPALLQAMAGRSAWANLCLQPARELI